MHTVFRLLTGLTIRCLRGKRSQREVARCADVPVGTWCQWERGHRFPQKTQLGKILTGLRISEEEFVVALLETIRHDLERRYQEYLPGTNSVGSPESPADVSTRSPIWLRPLLLEVIEDLDRAHAELRDARDSCCRLIGEDCGTFPEPKKEEKLAS